MKTKELKKEFESVCNKYAELFCKKHDLELDFWVGDEVGGTACCSYDYFFTLLDMVVDIDTNQPKGFVFEWYDYISETQFVNYKSYINGFRHEKINNNSPKTKTPF